ncbi:MAG: methyltransferase domain-containing protein [Candidatus Margulisbacteria bacterium]|nr:methyltransferase domain-containing protein [Candidatus Margulisiibacteriota bacterium]
MINQELICPDCRSALKAGAAGLVCAGGHNFTDGGGIYNLLPAAMSEMTRNDAAFHASQVSHFTEQAQMNSLRVLFFHQWIVDYIVKRTDGQTRVLELAGGSGFDLNLFLSRHPVFKDYVFSEISPEMAAYVKKNTDNRQVSYSCIDAHSLPFADETFKFVFIVAAFHHLCDAARAMTEMIRVSQPGGYIILGCEPNGWWLRIFGIIRDGYRKILPGKSHSPADDAADGFTRRKLEQLATLHGLKLLELQPIWLFYGFIHYGLELFYRLFRLKNRIKLPSFLEWAVLYVDTALLWLPGIRRLAWHYTAVYQKKMDGGL